MAKRKPKELNLSKLSITEISPKVQAVRSDFVFEKDSAYNAYFNIQLQPLYNLEAKAIKIELKVDIGFFRDEIDHPKVGEFAFEFIYEYDDMSNLIGDDGELDQQLFVVCANISYSSLRGIIYSISANTCLEQVLLPIVTGAELMKGLTHK